MSTSTAVLVVGGGLNGLTVAALLAHQGIDAGAFSASAAFVVMCFTDPCWPPPTSAGDLTEGAAYLDSVTEP